MALLTPLSPHSMSHYGSHLWVLRNDRPWTRGAATETRRGMPHLAIDISGRHRGRGIVRSSILNNWGGCRCLGQLLLLQEPLLLCCHATSSIR